MMKKLLYVTLGVLIIFSCVACKKKEPEPTVPQTQGPVVPMGQMPPGQMPPAQMPTGQMPAGQMPQGQMPMGQAPSGMPQGMMQKGQTKVMLPESVKGKWSAAKIIIEDKSNNSKQEYTVKLNSDFSVPNSALKVHVGEFLPDFRMDGLNLTSGSNDPKNPALGIRVSENNKQIFPAPGKQWGWLFAKVPTIHPFEHPKYGIVLKEGVRKS